MRTLARLASVLAASALVPFACGGSQDAADETGGAGSPTLGGSGAGGAAAGAGGIGAAGAAGSPGGAAGTAGGGGSSAGKSGAAGAAGSAMAGAAGSGGSGAGTAGASGSGTGGAAGTAGTGGAAGVGGCVSPPDGGPTLATPIRHLVVLMFENRTFDTLFTGFPGADTVKTAKLSTGKTITRPKAPDGELWSDIPHSHKAGLDAYSGGSMDGFDLLWKDHGSACASGKFASTNGYDPMSPFMAYEESQIPDLWAYAREFTLADKFFSTTLSNSEPGHFSIYAAQSPMIDNPRCNLTTPCALGCQSKKGETEITLANAKTCAESVISPACVDVPTVFDTFPTGLSWRSYAGSSSGVPNTPIALVKSLGTNAKSYAAHTRDYGSLVGDIQAGDLANVSYVHVGGTYDGHPPDGMCFTEKYAVNVLNAMMKSPLWASSAVLVTWDDWGGFYDHVKPAADGCDASGNHLHTGFRVPLLVVSPWAHRSGDPAKPFVFHGASEQASIPRLVEELFGGTTLPVGALSKQDPNARDAKAGSLLGAFDFTKGDCSTFVRPAKTCAAPAAAACP